jgi:hypothetical protein
MTARFPRINEIRAVIDRAYNSNSPEVLDHICKTMNILCVYISSGGISAAIVDSDLQLDDPKMSQRYAEYRRFRGTLARV